MGSVRGVVMFIDGQCVRVRTVHQNEYNLQTDKEVKRGEPVWVFFDKDSRIRDIVPLRTLEDNEIPPPDLEEPEHDPDLDLGLWDGCSPEM